MKKLAERSLAKLARGGTKRRRAFGVFVKLIADGSLGPVWVVAARPTNVVGAVRGVVYRGEMRTRWLLAMYAAPTLAIYACVGDSTTIGGPDATADSTSDSTSANDVVVADQNTVDAADAGMDAPADAPADVPVVDANDAGPVCDATVVNPFACDGGTPDECYDFSTTSHACVNGLSACEGTYSNIFFASCLATSQCPGATPWCCLSNSPTKSTDSLNGCPGTLTIGMNNGSFCHSSTDVGNCADSGIALCDTAAPCPNGHACVPVSVTQPPGLANKILGVCAP